LHSRARSLRDRSQEAGNTYSSAERAATLMKRHYATSLISYSVKAQQNNLLNDSPCATSLTSNRQRVDLRRRFLRARRGHWMQTACRTACRLLAHGMLLAREGADCPQPSERSS